MGRKPCCEKVGLKKGAWSPEEDNKLRNFILSNGQFCWRALPKLAGLMRCGKSCRLRWTNYLKPDLKRGFLSEDEEKLIIDLHTKLGNRWSKIASYLPGRTDNDIKNYWNTHVKKKLRNMGIDPLSHHPLPPPTTTAASSATAAAAATPPCEEAVQVEQNNDTEVTTSVQPTVTEEDKISLMEVGSNEECIEEMKGTWTAEEDKKLSDFILKKGQCSWKNVPKLAGLSRCSKSCRLRWKNYLRPDLKRGLLSQDEEKIVIDLHAKLGNRWSKIASHLPGRTDNCIKNYWNTHLKRKLLNMGIDPVNHIPQPSSQQPENQQPPFHQHKETHETPMQSTITEEKSIDTSPFEDLQFTPNFIDYSEIMSVLYDDML